MAGHRVTEAQSELWPCRCRVQAREAGPGTRSHGAPVPLIRFVQVAVHTRFHPTSARKAARRSFVYPSGAGCWYGTLLSAPPHRRRHCLPPIPESIQEASFPFVLPPSHSKSTPFLSHESRHPLALVSNTVQPLGSWEPSDRAPMAWIRQSSDWTSSSSRSGAGARRAVARGPVPRWCGSRERGTAHSGGGPRRVGDGSARGRRNPCRRFLR